MREVLALARGPRTALAVVLNRVPPEGIRDIGGHLASMLEENGLARAVLFAVPRSPPLAIMPSPLMRCAPCCAR